MIPIQGEAMATKRKGLDKNTLLYLERTKAITLAQAKIADDVLVELGIGGTYPSRNKLQARLMLVLATNMLAVIAGSARN